MPDYKPNQVGRDVAVMALIAALILVVVVVATSGRGVGRVVGSKAPNRPLPIASTTKLMTAYLALHELKPNQMVAAPSYHPSASAEIELGLRPGERMRVRDLLYGLLLPSASDAAETLAVGGSRSVPAFVTALNPAARRLGLEDTRDANPVGVRGPHN